MMRSYTTNHPISAGSLAHDSDSLEGGEYREKARHMHITDGQIVRGYQLQDRIGAGGFGAVYRAVQLSVNREVAVKIILPEHARRADFMRRFEAEARTVAQLDHLHIVPLFDYWQEPDQSAFLIMRYMRGGSLRGLLRGSRLSLEMTVRIIDQVCRALAFAHQKGVIHRDIKPDNILLDEQRNAYLSDFGIAKDSLTQAAIERDRASTDERQAPGTPAYAAPEQIFGQAVLPQTDLYALGITLYECLIGSHPFPGAPLQHLYDSLPSVSAQRSDVPAGIDDLIRRATQRNPNDRFPDAITMAAALRAAAARGGVIPAPEATDEPPSQKSGIDEEAGRATSRLPVEIAGVPSQPTIGITTPLVSSPGHKSQPPRQATESQLMTIAPSKREAPIDQSALLVRIESDVPLRPETLIGRDALMAEINALLDRNMRVVLQGLGGMGKTSLAAETLAARIQAGKAPGIWLHASGNDGMQFLTAIARVFNAHQDIARSDPATAAQHVRGLITEHDIKIVVLDDIWDGAALKMVIDAIPANIPVLITSRQRLPLGKIIDVGELMLSQAVELLNYHASEMFTLQDKDAVRLCERLGCHPFTVEIAGKTLQVDALTPAELLERIADAPHLLEMPHGYANPGRASVKALLNDSVFALDPDSRAMFLAFGVLFLPQATADMMARLMERDAQYVDAALTTLVRRGLARRERNAHGAVYFTIHDLAYSYAHENAVLPRASMTLAARSYAETHKDDLHALDAERGNILKAAEAAAKSGDTNSLIAIMRALTIDGNYFNARGYDVLMLSVLDRAIDTARADEAHAVTLHFFLSRRGNAHYAANNLPAALGDYQAALEIATRNTMPAREIILRCVISKIYSDTKAFDEAEFELETAQQLAEATQDDSLIARVLEQRGYHFGSAKKDFAAAQETYVQQVTLSEQSRSSERLFFALQNLGSCEIELNKFNDALQHLERALKIAQEADNRSWEAHALAPMSVAYLRLGNLDNARALFAQAVELSQQTGNTRLLNEIQQIMKEAGIDTP